MTPAFLKSVNIDTRMPEKPDIAVSIVGGQSGEDGEGEVLEEEDITVLDNTDQEQPGDEVVTEEPPVPSEPETKEPVAPEPAPEEPVATVPEPENPVEPEPEPIVPVPVNVNVGFPDHVDYLLIGAGTASFAAYRAIKAKDPLAKVLIVGEEDHQPYMRTPLSKEMWFMTDKEAVSQLKFTQWNGRDRSLKFEPASFYTPPEELSHSAKGGISVLTGRRVVKVDAGSQTATLADGSQIGFGKCLRSSA